MHALLMSRGRDVVNCPITRPPGALLPVAPDSAVASLNVSERQKRSPKSTGPETDGPYERA